MNINLRELLCSKPWSQFLNFGCRNCF